MIRHLSFAEMLGLHRRVLQVAGGAEGIRDLGALKSALAQPHMSFAGQDLYPDIVSKAVAIAYSLIANHPFVDGNKRVGHAALEAFLLKNGFEILARIDEQEAVFLSVAAGTMSRQALLEWVQAHLQSRVK